MRDLVVQLEAEDQSPFYETGREDFAGDFDLSDEIKLSRQKNRHSNEIFYKQNQVKVKHGSHVFLIEYYDVRAKKTCRKLRRGFPIFDFDHLRLNHMADHKFFNWRPMLKNVSLGLDENGKPRPTLLLVQDYPFCVLDIDDVSYNEIYKIIFVDKKWKFANENHVSVTPSTTGKGVHIHIALDMSEVPQNFVGKIPNSKVPTYYMETYKYRVFKKIQEWLADSFFEDTGIKPDLYTFSIDRIAITPREVGEINRQWEGRLPIKIKEEVFQDLDSYDPNINRKFSINAKAMISQLIGFITDKTALADWMVYLESIGIKPGNEQYYREVLGMVKNNIRTIERHISREYGSLFWARSKTENLSIPQKDICRMFFGLDTRRNETYFRHLVIYMLGLEVQRNYEAKKLTNVYRSSGKCRKYFKDDFLAKYWYVQDNSRREGSFHFPSIDEIANNLGSGNTHEVLRKLVKFLTSTKGADEAISILHESIDRSTANDKNDRKNFVSRFCLKLESQGEIACLRQETG